MSHKRMVVVTARPEPDTRTTRATATANAATTEQLGATTCALQQMADAGFELPPITTNLFSDKTECTSDPEHPLAG